MITLIYVVFGFAANFYVIPVKTVINTRQI